jgi:hypothetical protein
MAATNAGIRLFHLIPHQQIDCDLGYVILCLCATYIEQQYSTIGIRVVLRVCLAELQL